MLQLPLLIAGTGVPVSGRRLLERTGWGRKNGSYVHSIFELALIERLYGLFLVHSRNVVLSFPSFDVVLTVSSRLSMRGCIVSFFFFFRAAEAAAATDYSAVGAGLPRPRNLLKRVQATSR